MSHYAKRRSEYSGGRYFDQARVRIKRASPDGKVTFDMIAICKGRYDPGYPPVPCSNPDHPAYSDPGCGPELELDEVLEVEDVCIECEETELPATDQVLFDAIDRAWETQSRLSKEGDRPRADEYKQLAGWLEELLACRYGIGPWSTLELTDDELGRLEEAMGHESNEC